MGVNNGWLTLFLLFSPVLLLARPASSELAYLRFLYENERFDEALQWVQMVYPAHGSSAQMDSMWYLAGKSAYYLDSIPLSANFFQKVSSEPLASYAKLWHALILTEEDEWRDARKILADMSIRDSAIQDARHFFTAAVSKILNEDSASTTALKKASTLESPIDRFEDDLKALIESRDQLKHRSPFLAGLLSSVLPASGKFYAGHSGEGISNLTMMFFLAVQAGEGFWYEQWESPHFYVYGGLFTLFYAGTVWGSVMRVKIDNNKLQQNWNDEVRHLMFMSLYALDG